MDDDKISINIFEYGSKEHTEAFELRVKDFAEPLGFTREDVLNTCANESDQTHICALKGNTVVGCCILVQESPTKMKLRQLVVKKGLRRQQIGTKLLQFVKKYATSNGTEIIYSDVMNTALNFYLANNWKIHQDPVTIIGILHYPMSCDIRSP